MLKLKLPYFGHLMQRADSFEKTLMLGKIESRRRVGAEEFCFLPVSYSHCTICPRQLVYSFPVLFWVVNRFTQRGEKKGENKGYATKRWGMGRR